MVLALQSLAALQLILLLCSRRANGRVAPGKPLQADFSVYHKMDEIFAIVDDIVLQNQDRFTLDVFNFKMEDNIEPSEYYQKVVTVAAQDSNKDFKDKLRVYLDFGQHGREMVTTEVAVSVLKALSNQTYLAEVMGSEEQAAQTENILQDIVLKIVPIDNVTGRRKVENGWMCERKNGRGTDPNRNFSVDWGKREKDFNPKEEYPGSEPFSEPEAKAVKQLSDKFHPHVWVSMHSGMLGLFQPFDHITEEPKGPIAEAAHKLLALINEEACNGRCHVGSGGKEVGYRAHGTATDYMYLKQHVPLAFTWEIYGDIKARYHECFRMFNPLTTPELDVVVQQWTRAVFVMLNNVANNKEFASFLPIALGGEGSDWEQREKEADKNEGGSNQHDQTAAQTQDEGGSDTGGVGRQEEGVNGEGGKQKESEGEQTGSGGATEKSTGTAIGNGPAEGSGIVSSSREGQKDTEFRRLRLDGQRYDNQGVGQTTGRSSVSDALATAAGNALRARAHEDVFQGTGQSINSQIEYQSKMSERLGGEHHNAYFSMFDKLITWYKLQWQEEAEQQAETGKGFGTVISQDVGGEGVQSQGGVKQGGGVVGIQEPISYGGWMLWGGGFVMVALCVYNRRKRGEKERKL